MVFDMKRLIAIVLLGLTCCTTEKKKIEVVQEVQIKPTWNKEFLEFVSLLPKIKLPFKATCENCCDDLGIDFKHALVEKFKPHGSNLVGLVDKTDNQAVILVTYPADAIIPSVKVYDMNGKLTGDMTFLTGYCGGDAEYYGKQFFSINSDLSFNQIDTSYYLTLDSVDYQTRDTTKIEITKKKFIINDKGQIVEDNTR